ncbi:MAG: hypothetical protein WCT43_02755 [Candidatus Magasanikbacteria bacterium]
MPEDTLPTDFEQPENEPTKPEETPEEIPEIIPPKKRITRHRLSEKVKTSIPTPAEKKQEKMEINEVLTNLYGDQENSSNVQEITMKQPGLFFRLLPIIGVALVFVGVVWAGFIFLPQKSQSQVDLSISGPKELSLGATTTYSIAFENNSNVNLSNVVLNAYYPEGFVFLESNPKPNNAGHNEWNLSTLDAYEKGSVTITGLTYGSINDQKSWRVFLNYSPENFNSELQKAATLTTVIVNSPVKLTISGPDKASVGSDATYTFTLQKNLAWKGLMSVVPQVPANFTITSSSPALDRKTNQWLIPALVTSTKESANKTFTLTGKFTSAPSESNPIKGVVLIPASPGQNYQIASAQISTELLNNDVSVSLAINGTVADFDSRPGDVLNITIRVKNQSANDITGVIPKITLTAPSDKKISLLKWAEIVDKNENTIVGEQVDDTTRRGIISWNSDQIAALSKIKAGSDVTIDIQLPIKNAKEFKLENIKSPLITAVAEVKYKDITKVSQIVGTKPIAITLNSDLSFSSDDTISDAGTDSEKHTINWTLNNNFHALKDIQIVATTFGDINFTLLNKAAGDFVYSENDNKITWKLTDMPESADVLNTSFSLTLQKRNPTQTLLLSKAHLTATDAVTGKTIDLAGEEIPVTNQQ